MVNLDYIFKSFNLTFGLFAPYVKIKNKYHNMSLANQYKLFCNDLN
jgi:hypothetical protein